MASRAKVVLDLVGPYAQYGRPVIEACVAEGAHYVDLSGEIPFVSDVIVDFGARAEQAGVKIVQVCGFEALPPDMAVALAAEAARERWDEALADVELEATFEQPPGLPRPSDVLSGGTIQSIAGIAGAPNAAAAVDPAALIDDPKLAEAVRARSPIKVAPRRNSRGAVLAPMTPAAFINPAIMHRTAELSGSTEPFRYREGLAIPGPEATLPLRYVAAGAMSATQAGIAALLRSPRQSMRSKAAEVMGSVLPGSGFGPSAERLEQWSWGMRIDARTAGGNEVRVDVDADGHPGIPGDLADDRRGRAAAGRGWPHARYSGRDHAVDRSRYRLRRALREGAAALLGRLTRNPGAPSRAYRATAIQARKGFECASS